MEDAPTPPRRNWFEYHPNAIIWIGLVLLIFGGIAAVAVWMQPGLSAAIGQTTNRSGRWRS